MRWKVFNRGDTEIKLSKTGDNYCATLKEKGELIMTIFQTPLTSMASTDVQAGVSVYDARGVARVDHSKQVKGGEPLVLFKEDNVAGLKLVKYWSNAKANLNEAMKDNPDIKIDIDKLVESNTYQVQENNRVVLGSSTIQISKNSVSIVHSPEIESHKETIEMFLKFMTKSLMGEQLKYRSNVMLLDITDYTLKIEAHYNMDGDRDRNFKISAGAGGAGEALRRDNIEIVDLNRHSHAYYNIDSTKVWPEMRSLFSIPIHDSEQNILGVLNIDTNRNIVDTKFDDSHFQSCVGIASDILGRLLMIGNSNE